MKSTAFIFIVFYLLLSACSNIDSDASTNSEYKIKITGTEGVEFTANIGGASAINGLSGTKLYGAVPAEYTVSGDYIGGMFRKHSDNGTLKVQIIKDGMIVAQSETSVPQGVLIVEAVP